jgi:hypothetical protein
MPLLRCAATDSAAVMRSIGLEEMLLSYLCTKLSYTLLKTCGISHFLEEEMTFLEIQQ